MTKRMVMEKPVYVNGKKYVFINRLPSKERLAFINYASFDYLVSVGQPEIANEPCASYSDYKFWYDQHFSASMNEEDFF